MARPPWNHMVILGALALFTGAVAACAGGFAVPRTASATATPTAPTATPVPLAAQVNGEAIPLADYLAEIARFEEAHAGLGTDLASMGDYRGEILQSLVDQKLLAQAARSAGLAVTAAEVDARLQELAFQAGGNEALGAWLARSGYELAGFQAAVTEEMLAQKMVEEIAAGVGSQAEQVHARHLLVSSPDQAEALRARVLAGEEFALLARQFTLDLSTRPAGGDLGWFPRGVLLTPEVEEAAFGLAPGEVSSIVQSHLGYHLVVTIERGDHPLSPYASLRLRELAVQDWLTAERSAAAIEILATP